MQPIIETEPIIETRGDDWIWPLALTDENDAAIDLTGCAFDDAAIKWRDGTVPLEIANGRLVVDAAAGGITITQDIRTIRIAAQGLAGPQGPMGPAGPQGNTGPQGPAGPLAADISTGDISGTTYTVAAADLGTRKRTTSGSAVTITLPNDRELGFSFLLCQAAAGQVTFSAAAGATLHGRSGSVKTAGQWSEASLTVDSNAGGSSAVWVLSGDLTS